MTGTLNTTRQIRDINAGDYKARLNTITAATTLSRANDNQTVVINNATGFATTLPSALGLGTKLKFFIATTVSSGNHTIVAAGSDVMKGFAHLFGDDTSALGGFATTSGTTITMDGTTRGGFAGDYIEIEDVASGVWSVRMYGHATGTEATPFS